MIRFLSFITFSIFSFHCTAQTTVTHSAFQQNLQHQLAQGWNTWSYGSMLSHVLLPEGLCMRINFRNAFIGTPYDPDYFYEDITVDKTGRVRPIAHTFDGSYTELIIDNWYGNRIRVQSATSGGDVVLLVTPLITSATRYHIELQTGILWNQPGQLQREGDYIKATLQNRAIDIRSTQKSISSYHNYTSPYLVVSCDSTVAFYTGVSKSTWEIKEIIKLAETAYHQRASKYQEKAEAFMAIQSVLGWNTIYDPANERVISPVTRGWNEAWHGYVLFEWDTYFAALLFGLHEKELAYSNAIAITKGTRPELVGFWQMPGNESVQSQPPVGSLVCWLLYEKFQEKEFLAEVYDDLLEWNRWWVGNRLNKGYLTWGAPWKGAEPKHALLESGLDNSPMYEDVMMQEVGEISLFNLADVGLNSLYVADCKYLARIANVLGKSKDEKELLDRAAAYSKQVQKLWNEEKGIFLNKYLDRQESSTRLSPTLFYPMLAGIATPKQAERMIQAHLCNPNEFWGMYPLPSIAYNDKNFDNNYWRGSVWGPMNFLVYLGLKQYDPRVARKLAQKSYDPFMEAWKEHHYVFENINSIKGVMRSADQINSDPYYHWGALMGLMLFIEDNQY